jgi:SOS-response transcriptional repressor LexA
MTPIQREVFLYIDEYWKIYGCSPSYREIAEFRGKPGLGNTKKIIDRLVKQGILKKVDKMSRTVRPVYINFRNIK